MNFETYVLQPQMFSTLKNRSVQLDFASNWCIIVFLSNQCQKVKKDYVIFGTLTAKSDSYFR